MKTPEPRNYAKPREALKKSERKASEPQPENFKDDENDDKLVEIGPIDRKGSAIKGLDPEK
ncbi:MAG TPA: hypothetical protein VFG60_02725 [Burkholderiaceae bacterium]|nr:hypothetical protein [Burkholderiaceae bacterium]